MPYFSGKKDKKNILNVVHDIKCSKMNTSPVIHVTLDLVYMLPVVSTISISQNKLFHTTINHNAHNFEFRVGKDGYNVVGGG